MLYYLLSLCYTNRVGMKVTEVNSFALGFHIRVFAGHQPTNMCEEEATLCIVGVAIGLGVFVVDSVVTCPLYDVILRLIKKSTFK